MQRTITIGLVALAMLTLSACLGAAPTDLVDDPERCSSDGACPEPDMGARGTDVSGADGAVADLGSGGDADAEAPPPCGGACAPAYCDEMSGTCLECADDGDCAPGACANGVCVECTGNEHCVGGVCTDESTCVECVVSQDCAADQVCSGDKRCVECQTTNDCGSGVCDTAAEVCVECLENTDCPDDDASRCNPDTNLCEGCAESSQCGHLAATQICDVGAATCVECLDDSPATRAACNGKSCNPETSTCTGTLTGSRMLCESCVADSECGSGFGCVAMNFNGTSLPDDVGYCLKMAPRATDCVRPFRAFITRATFSDPVPHSFCSLSESITTCEAYLDLRTDVACTDQATECGITGLMDGACFGARCTIPCELDGQCPESMRCDATKVCVLN